MKVNYMKFYVMFICLTACQSREEMCKKVTSAMHKEKLSIRVLSKDKDYSGRISNIEVEDLNYKNMVYTMNFDQFFYGKIFKLFEIGDTIIKEKGVLKYCI